MASTILTKEELQSYWLDGYVLKRGLIDADKVQTLRDRFQAVTHGSIPPAKGMLVMRDVLVDLLLRHADLLEDPAPEPPQVPRGVTGREPDQLSLAPVTGLGGHILWQRCEGLLHDLDVLAGDVAGELSFADGGEGRCRKAGRLGSARLAVGGAWVGLRDAREPLTGRACPGPGRDVDLRSDRGALVVQRLRPVDQPGELAHHSTELPGCHPFGLREGVELTVEVVQTLVDDAAQPAGRRVLPVWGKRCGSRP